MRVAEQNVRSRDRDGPQVMGYGLYVEIWVSFEDFIVHFATRASPAVRQELLFDSLETTLESFKLTSRFCLETGLDPALIVQLGSEQDSLGHQRTQEADLDEANPFSRKERLTDARPWPKPTISTEDFTDLGPYLASGAIDLITGACH